MSYYFVLFYIILYDFELFCTISDFRLEFLVNSTPLDFTPNIAGQAMPPAKSRAGGLDQRAVHWSAMDSKQDQVQRGLL